MQQRPFFAPVRSPRPTTTTHPQKQKQKQTSTAPSRRARWPSGISNPPRTATARASSAGCLAAAPPPPAAPPASERGHARIGPLPPALLLLLLPPSLPPLRMRARLLLYPQAHMHTHASALGRTTTQQHKQTPQPPLFFSLLPKPRPLREARRILLSSRPPTLLPISKQRAAFCTHPSALPLEKAM